jgi:hypothetical protein
MQNLRMSGDITPVHYCLHAVHVGTSQFVRRILNTVENLNVKKCKKLQFCIFFWGAQKPLKHIKNCFDIFKRGNCLGRYLDTRGGGHNNVLVSKLGLCDVQRSLTRTGEMRIA